MGAVARGWKVKQVLLKDLTWVKEAKTWFPEVDLVCIDNVGIDSQDLVSVYCWFSDVDPPRKLNLWESYSTSLIVLTRRARHVQGDGWNMQRTTISHVDCGGITDGSWEFINYSKDSSFILDHHSPTSGRDLSSVLNSMLSGLPCSAPSVVYLDKPRVLQLRPRMYHGGGLLPWGERKGYVLVPSTFSPTGWC